MMVLPLNFRKLFGLNSKALCYYPATKIFLSGESNIPQKQAVIKFIEKMTDIKDGSKAGGQYLCLTWMKNVFLKF